MIAVAGPDGLQGQLDQSVRDLDWTLDGCVFDREETFQRSDGLEGMYRVWTNCFQSGLAFYDGMAAPAGGEYVAYIQIQVPPDEEEIADRILESFRILPEKIER